ncbi:MAG: hypothetical protein FWE70_08860 [Oscillospiraceae bacterium]|nr:hypothetical protein [Oscillospiraceae bacterium]
MWGFRYDGDPYKEGTMVDLRHMNERVAGETGFVRLSEDGEGFLLGSGEPVRFWAYNTTLHRKPMDELKRHARFLAKLGINMVRMHGSANPKKPGQSILECDEENMDQAWKLVAAMKEQGIYVTMSPYWPHNGHCGGVDPEAYWGIKDYSGKQGLWGVLFFNEELQEGYRAWTKALYTRTNPYTGIPLCEDPALAIIQIQNEDSLLWGSTNGIHGAQRRLLESRFADWLAGEYGSLGLAVGRWAGTSLPEDSLSGRRMGIHKVYEMTVPQEGGMRERINDEVRFLARTMYDFNAMAARHYRSMGCRQLINANNWKAADYVRLNDIERWTYTANEVMAVNRYYTGIHDGPRNGWRIDVGDRLLNRSIVDNPRRLPINLRQIAGSPLLVTESTWVPPLEFQSEAPLMVAAYQSLTGVSAYYWFATSDVYYTPDDHFYEFDGKPEFERGHFKWASNVPAIQGMFPAAALMYRNGYIKQGEPVVSEERTMEDLWARNTPALPEDESYDPIRDEGLYGRDVDLEGGADPLAFLVGPVKVRLGAERNRREVADLSKYIDREGGQIRSVTGELLMDYGRRAFTLDAPKAKGFAGFLRGAGEVALDGLRLCGGNDYMSVYAVSMDGADIRDSGMVLIQVAGVFKPDGMETEPAVIKDGRTGREMEGEAITKTGRMPWVSEDIDLTLSLDNGKVARWHRLDPNGEAVGTEGISRGADGWVSLRLPSDAMYVVLEA